MSVRPGERAGQQLESVLFALGQDGQALLGRYAAIHQRERERHHRHAELISRLAHGLRAAGHRLLAGQHIVHLHGRQDARRARGASRASGLAELVGLQPKLGGFAIRKPSVVFLSSD